MSKQYCCDNKNLSISLALLGAYLGAGIVNNIADPSTLKSSNFNVEALVNKLKNKQTQEQLAGESKTLPPDEKPPRDYKKVTKSDNGKTKLNDITQPPTLTQPPQPPNDNIILLDNFTSFATASYIYSGIQTAIALFLMNNSEFVINRYIRPSAETIFEYIIFNKFEPIQRRLLQAKKFLGGSADEINFKLKGLVKKLYNNLKNAMKKAKGKKPKKEKRYIPPTVGMNKQYEQEMYLILEDDPEEQIREGLHSVIEIPPPQSIELNQNILKFFRNTKQEKKEQKENLVFNHIENIFEDYNIKKKQQSRLPTSIRNNAQDQLAVQTIDLFNDVVTTVRNEITRYENEHKQILTLVYTALKNGRTAQAKKMLKNKIRLIKSRLRTLRENLSNQEGSDVLFNMIEEDLITLRQFEIKLGELNKFMKSEINKEFDKQLTDIYGKNTNIRNAVKIYLEVLELELEEDTKENKKKIKSKLLEIFEEIKDTRRLRRKLATLKSNTTRYFNKLKEIKNKIDKLRNENKSIPEELTNNEAKEYKKYQLTKKEMMRVNKKIDDIVDKNIKIYEEQIKSKKNMLSIFLDAKLFFTQSANLQISGEEYEKMKKLIQSIIESDEFIIQEGVKILLNYLLTDFSDEDWENLIIIMKQTGQLI